MEIAWLCYSPHRTPDRTLVQIGNDGATRGRKGGLECDNVTLGGCLGRLCVPHLISKGNLER